MCMFVQLFVCCDRNKAQFNSKGFRGGKLSHRIWGRKHADSPPRRRKVVDGTRSDCTSPSDGRPRLCHIATRLSRT